VISSIEGDGILQPLEVRGHGYVDRANLTEFTLPLAHGELSRASPKDQDTVPNLGEAFPLGVVVLVLAGCSASSLAIMRV